MYWQNINLGHTLQLQHALQMHHCLGRFLLIELNTLEASGYKTTSVDQSYQILSIPYMADAQPADYRTKNCKKQLIILYSLACLTQLLTNSYTK